MGYEFDVTCQGSLPESIIAFLESDSYEDVVRNAVSLGGDADTQACIAGAIAEAFNGGVPEPIVERVVKSLPPLPVSGNPPLYSAPDNTFRRSSSPTSSAPASAGVPPITSLWITSPSPSDL